MGTLLYEESATIVHYDLPHLLSQISVCISNYSAVSIWFVKDIWLLYMTRCLE